MISMQGCVQETLGRGGVFLFAFFLHLVSFSVDHYKPLGGGRNFIQEDRAPPSACAYASLVPNFNFQVWYFTFAGRV